MYRFHKILKKVNQLYRYLVAISKQRNFRPLTTRCNKFVDNVKYILWRTRTHLAVYLRSILFLSAVKSNQNPSNLNRLITFFSKYNKSLYVIFLNQIFYKYFTYSDPCSCVLVYFIQANDWVKVVVEYLTYLSHGHKTW